MKVKAFSRSGKDTRSLIVFDIGSGSVGAALAVLSPGEVPKILYSTRNAISFHKTTPRFPQLTKSMLATLLNTMLEVQMVIPQLLEKEGISQRDKLVDHVLTVFSSPWSIVEIKTLSIEKEKPFMLTQQVTERFVREEVSKFIGENTKKTTIKSENRNLASVDCEIIQITLNGYQTSNPYHKYIKKAHIYLGLSAVSREVYDKTSEIVEELLDDKNGDLHAFPLASFLAARDVFKKGDDFILLDISAEMSDISLVENGALVHLVSFTKGRHLIFREISKSLKVSLEETRSLLHLYFSGKMGQKQKQELMVVMELVADEWTDSLSGALKAVRGKRGLPKTLLLTADQDLSGWFKKVLEKFPSQNLIFSDTHFDVTVLDSAYFANHITGGGGEWGLDPFLALDILFYKRKLGI